MLSHLRNRVGIPGVLATVAIVLAMTGGAWAAGKYIITSTKQIKPSVLSALKGKTGPAGPAGANGTNGANGAPGANGVSVTNTKLEPGEGGCAKGGAEFKVGAGAPTVACNGEPGEPGEAGPEGSPWVAGSVPSGSELRGTWALNTNAKESEGVFTAVTTGVPLANPVSLVVRGPATLGTLECAGTAESPLPPTNEGSPINGIICLYTGESTNLEGGAIKKVGSSKGGVVVKMTTTEAGPASGFGSWSMYAP